MTKKIAFQGELGAYSHHACLKSRPNYKPISCKTFEEVIDYVKAGKADLAMLPIENSTYGRVADIHRLLPHSQLNIIGEVFIRVNFFYFISIFHWNMWVILLDQWIFFANGCMQRKT